MSVYDFSTLQPIFPDANVRAMTWCPGLAPYDTSPTNIQQGVLYPYNSSAAIYHCPADDSSVRTPAGASLGIPRTRSYNMSESVNGIPMTGPFAYMASLLVADLTLSSAHDPGPSDLFVFIDVHEGGIFDSQFGMPLPGSYWDGVWFDLPANRHSQGCNLSFADGHVEHWHWTVPKNFQYIGQRVAPGEQPDYDRIRAHMKMKAD